LIRLTLVDPENLKLRKVRRVYRGKPTPFTFEYVLLFFMLPKDRLWTANSIAERGWTKEGHEFKRHWHNIYHFSNRKGIVEEYDNIKEKDSDPSMWDSDTWLYKLNDPDHDRGVHLFRTLWKYYNLLKSQGRDCDFYYTNGEILIVEKSSMSNSNQGIELNRFKPFMFAASLLIIFFLHGSKGQQKPDQYKLNQIAHELRIEEDSPANFFEHSHQESKIQQQDLFVENTMSTPLRISFTFQGMHPTD